MNIHQVLENEQWEHFSEKGVKYPYKWTSSTIAHILQKHEYLGHTVNFKTRKHFKDEKSHYVDKDQWLIFADTHEPIIDQETFDNVQRIRGQVRRYPDGWGEAHPLTGLMYCADCGGKMYVHRVNNGKRVPMYVCGNYAKQPVGILCKSAHRIKADHVMEIAANEFVEKIVVHERDRKGSADTTQKIEIYFNFIGEYIPPIMAEKEPRAVSTEQREWAWQIMIAKNRAKKD